MTEMLLRKNLELSKCNRTVNRDERLNAFMTWIHSNNVDTSNFEICSFENYGYGLKAKKNLSVYHFTSLEKIIQRNLLV